jgi:hypothetical protein
MRHGSGQGQNGGSNRRNRNRNNNQHRRNGNGNGGGMSSRNQVFDSNGPDVRIRGTAPQIVEKYAALAKDANSSGDRSLAENYLQHAEHYQRMIVEWDYEAQKRFEANNDERIEQPHSVNEQASEQAPEQSEKARKPVKRTKINISETEDDDLGLPASILKKAPVEKETA